MAWAFVDYENTGPLKEIDLSEYKRVIVLCGPRNKSFEFGTLPGSEFSRIELIPVATSGPNNLDFHLAFHLGRLHETADRQIEFHILSSDAGFDGLVSHLKKAGRKCKRVAVEKGRIVGGEPMKKKTKKKKKAAKKAAKGPAPEANGKPLDGSARNVAKALAALEDAKRPKTEAKLASWIEGRLKSTSDRPGAPAIIDELVAAQKIEIGEGRVSYSLNGAPKNSLPALPAANGPASAERISAPPSKEVTDELPF